jgi:hypothetical protein
VPDDEKEMLKKVWETRKQLSEERWILKTKAESPKTNQTPFIAIKQLMVICLWSMIIDEMKSCHNVPSKKILFTEFV